MLLTLEIRFWIILSIALVCYLIYLFFLRHQKIILKPINKVKKIKTTKNRIKRAKAGDFVPLEVADYQDLDIAPPRVENKFVQAENNIFSEKNIETKELENNDFENDKNQNNENFYQDTEVKNFKSYQNLDQTSEQSEKNDHSIGLAENSENNQFDDNNLDILDTQNKIQNPRAENSKIQELKNNEAQNNQNNESQTKSYTIKLKNHSQDNIKDENFSENTKHQKENLETDFEDENLSQDVKQNNIEQNNIQSVSETEYENDNQTLEKDLENIPNDTKPQENFEENETSSQENNEEIENENIENKNIENKNIEEAEDFGAKNIEENKQNSQEIQALETKRLQKQIEAKISAIRYEALAFKETGNLENYERKLIEGLSIDNENQEFIEMLGSLYFYEEKYNKSLALLKRAADKNPDGHNVLWQLGYIYQRKGEVSQAQDFYQRAIFLKPDNTKYLMSLVDLNYEKKNFEQALEYSIQALELKPTNITYVLATAAIYDAMGDLSRAQDFYAYAYNLDPNHPIVQKKLLRDM